MCEVLVEQVGVMAVQCIPPVQAPWEGGLSRPEASWVGAAAVAKLLPECDGGIKVSEEAGDGEPRLVLSGERVPWIFSKQCDVMQSDGEKRQHLIFAEFGSILITVFQPQGRLTDAFEET
jgi:hypothetical protein